jgi:hypothetical protein
VFALGSLPAWVRFSSDPGAMNSDLETTSGVGIKLSGVPARSRWATATRDAIDDRWSYTAPLTTFRRILAFHKQRERSGPTAAVHLGFDLQGRRSSHPRFRSV